MGRFALALVCPLLLQAASCACSIPVFRFALENWSPSKYELLVFHSKPLGNDDLNVLAGIRTQLANANVVTVDLAGTVDSKLQKLWDREGNANSGPWVIVRYPDAGEMVPIAWKGLLSKDSVAALFESDARRHVFKHLTHGYAATIILLRSGDKKADNAARTFLTNHLPRIANRIELPAKTEDGPKIKSEVPIRIEFPVVEVERGSSESVLVKILLGSEDGLDKVEGPIAFPVFGRGRALCALHGKDFEKPNELQRALEYLCKACSCQVKELNPGLDLLIAGAWDTIFDVVKAPAPREAVLQRAEQRLSGSVPEQSSPRSAPPAGYEAVEFVGSAESENARPGWKRYLLYAAGTSLLLSAAWLIGGRHHRNRAC